MTACTMKPIAIAVLVLAPIAVATPFAVRAAQGHVHSASLALPSHDEGWLRALHEFLVRIFHGGGPAHVASPTMSAPAAPSVPASTPNTQAEGASSAPAPGAPPSPRALTSAPTVGKFDLSTTGIEWHRGLDSVRDQGRPILLFQLLGDFDDVAC